MTSPCRMPRSAATLSRLDARDHDASTTIGGLDGHSELFELLTVIGFTWYAFDSRSARFLERSDLDLHRLGLAIAPECDVGGGARRDLGDTPSKLLGIFHGFTIDRGDNVAGF